MYVIVNYKKNDCVQKCWSKFIDAFKYYEKNIKNPDYKIEHWDFELGKCQLVWTSSYELNPLV